MGWAVTKQEWELIAGVMEWECVEYLDFVANDQRGKCVIHETFLMIRDGRVLRPLHDYNDLARLVEAMQAAGYTASRWAWGWGNRTHETLVHYQGKIISKLQAPTDIVATFWACVEALKAQEGRDPKLDAATAANAR